MEIRPVDLPALRDRLIEVVADVGTALYLQALRLGSHPFVTDRSHRTAARMAADEISRLRNATLFHVSEAMVQLAETAAATLPDYLLDPDDVPSPAGFMALATPLKVSEVSFHAVGWRVWTAGTTDAEWGRQGGVLISWYAEPQMETTKEFLDLPASERDDLVRRVGPLIQDRDSLIPFDLTRDEVTDSDSAVEKTLKSIWLLMQQPLTSDSLAQYNRSALRRFARNGQEPPAVRVLTLRRPSTPSGVGGDSDREYHHQWIVRGHWRQQWYPGRQVHRPVWIAPHIKGPEGSPLLGGEKVYALRR